MLRRGYGEPDKAPTREERRKQKAERIGKITFIDHGFERQKVVGFRKGRRRQDVP